MSRSFKDKLHLARRLSPADWLLLVEAWWVLGRFSIRLRRMSFERLQATFQLLRGKGGNPDQAFTLATRLKDLLSLAARLHIRPLTCLPRACALQWMLGRRGIPSRLRIGVNRSGQSFQAHAWVEVSGRPVGEMEGVEKLFPVLQNANAAASPFLFD